ncbi:MAG: ribosome biogenesis GTP-binding protein YihA/YsxC [Eubacterium sp.]|nr:ribosome biogenesis GTP-binding protein YihA/YsxC [Eubacterium sp.]MDE6767142.1 ribosome biogenesis GTP-binding protein YihA/YsxC [Eubacterium sp.]
MNYNKAEFERAYGLLSQLPESNSPEIAFAGRSNVGKSSLLNKLFNRKQLARVSSVPGKTITINFYNVDDNKFVDLPGYGYARLSKQELGRFSGLMEGYFKTDRNIVLVVQLIDMRHPLTKDDEGMIEFMKAMDIPFIIVMTKADKLKKKAYEERLKLSKQELAFAGNVPVVPFSAVTGQGLNGIKNYIENAICDAGGQ